MIDFDEHPRILLFDGVCNLCNGLVQFTIKRDPNGSFKFASLQSDAGQSILRHFGLNQNDLDTFVYVRNGHAYIKSDAGFYTCLDLGWPWKLAFAFILVPRPIRDWIYDRVASSRYAIFGKKDQCMIPTADITNRFFVEQE